ncbi:unnamed protein product [Pelagomonas calceolata]|uniref:PHD-type domain-containing protein n=1 Tax=Pelagomonas calceolata TaxID=35677 RepID=A0A8J2ST53_9STRA|nr:unnamed protein product [Pelagomonas calceolata]
MRTRPRRTKVAEDKAQQRRQRRDERAARRRRRQQGSDDEDDDEALARRLQRQYDDEARGRRRSKKRRRSEEDTGLARKPPTPRRSEVTRRESFGVRLKLNGETSEKLIASPPKRPVVPLPTPPKEGLTPDLDLEPWKVDGWDALCLVCGDGGDVACCDGCPAVIHPACAGLAKMPEEDEPFFCRTCEKDRCGCCLEGPIRKEDHVVCGEERASMRALGCGRTFHLSCVELEKVPEGDWLCASCQEEDEERELEVPRREPDAELLLDAEDYLKLQQRRLRAGDRRGAARCYLEARKSQLRAHSQSVEKGAPPRVRLVSYSTKRRGRANAPWARRIFDATSLDHPAFSATPENRAAMMMGILPSRRYAAGWSHEDVARARSSTPSLVAEPEPVQLRNREVVRKAPRSRVDDINERKTLRKKQRCDEFLQQNRSQSGGRDLDGRDEEVRALIRKDWKLRAIIDESRREIQAYRGRVVTLAYGDLLGQLRAVACVEEVASVLRREFGEAVSVDAIHLDLKTTFSRY